jgi:hypothetical protein
MVRELDRQYTSETVIMGGRPRLSQPDLDHQLLWNFTAGQKSGAALATQEGIEFVEQLRKGVGNFCALCSVPRHSDGL